MDLHFTSEGKIKVNVVKYVKDTVKMFPEEVKGKVAIPAAEHLREVNDQAERLPEKQAQLFHTIVARSLFCGKRARPDTLPTVAFLCTRVEGPDVDDWKKITRMMTNT